MEWHLKAIHLFSMYNKKILIDKNCKCFYCMEKFPSKKIKEWTDKGQTALCPKCGIDSVVPSTIDVDDETLGKLREYSFIRRRR